MSREVIVISSSSDDETDGETKPMESARRKVKEEPEEASEEEEEEEEEEDDDDCCILSFNPFLDEVIDRSRRLSLSDTESLDGLEIVAERGQVACRDYPHSRHLCGNYPFNKTSHESYCLKCFCYVREVAAPCESWKEKDGGHCDASENISWKSKRNELRCRRADA